ncbi:hypothetical protein OAH93_02075 [Flavobacteriales bacterium]|jgi:hypothetical protein|nr:hypothetical protein [Flavobacteriales bacterium]
MSYGLEIFASNGNSVYNSDDVTWNQVDFFSVSGGSSASNSYSVLSGRDVLVQQVQINSPPLTRKALSHTISVSGTTVSVSGGSEDAYILVLMK